MRTALVALAFLSACAPQDRDHVALSEVSWSVHNGDRDHAEVVYQDLVDDDGDPFTLALVASILEDDDAKLRHLEDGVAQGDPQSCLYLAWQQPEAALATAADVAATIDNHEDCRARALEAGHDVEDYRYVDGLLTDLEDEARADSPSATSLRDSLEAEGVFERQPRLRALVESSDATDA